MITCDGSCCCRCCKPDAYPDGPRLSELHTGARFGDFDPASPYGHLLRLAHVFLDGEEVTEQAREANPGVLGFVVVMPLDEEGCKHICRTCVGADPQRAYDDGRCLDVCERTIHGDVRIATCAPLMPEVTEVR